MFVKLFLDWNFPVFSTWLVFNRTWMFNPVESFQPRSFFGSEERSTSSAFHNVSSSSTTDADPLEIVSRYLESGSSDKCNIETPRAHFEVHQFSFHPFGDKSSAFSVVCLSMIDCGPQDELRPTVVRHILKEMTKLGKWQALVIYRLNGELQPHLDALYQHIFNEMNSGSGNVTVDPKHKFVQIQFQQPQQRQTLNFQQRPPPRRRK